MQIDHTDGPYRLSVRVRKLGQGTRFVPPSMGSRHFAFKYSCYINVGLNSFFRIIVCRRIMGGVAAILCIFIKQNTPLRLSSQRLALWTTRYSFFVSVFLASVQLARRFVTATAAAALAAIMRAMI